MMYDFDSLVGEVLRSRPEMTRESLLGLVQEKKRTVGSGYLTDQGALFLIAGELGVRLQHMVSADLTLKDVQVGANDITVVARVLAVYPISEFKRKDGSGVGRYRRVVLFDSTGVGRLTIWDDNEEVMKLSGVEIDTPVRVVGAYVKPGLDGRPNLNLGKRGRIEVLTDARVLAKLPSLAVVANKTMQAQEGEAVPAVEGTVATESRRTVFVRRDDGSNGSLVQFELKAHDGRTTRVVVWDADERIQAKLGSSIRVTNLRNKRGRQGDSELHGDVATVVSVIQVGESGGQSKMIKVADAAKHSADASVSVEVIALSKGQARDVRLKDGTTAKKGEVVLGDETGEITAVAWYEASKMLADVQVGEKLVVHGARVQVSKMGAGTLELGNASRLERLSRKV